MSVVLVREVKYVSVGKHTDEQRLLWERFLLSSEKTGRASMVPGTSTFLGNDWLIDCDDWEHAEWLCGWLIESCGFMRSMLQIKKTR